MNSKRHKGRSVLYEGRRWTVYQLEKNFGFAPGIIVGRLKRGWTVEEAVRTPVGYKRLGHGFRLKV